MGYKVLFCYDLVRISGFIFFGISYNLIAIYDISSRILGKITSTNVDVAILRQIRDSKQISTRYGKVPA